LVEGGRALLDLGPLGRELLAEPAPLGDVHAELGALGLALEALPPGRRRLAEEEEPGEDRRAEGAADQHRDREA